MTTLNDYFSGSFLKAASLQGKKVKLTIREISEFESQEGKTQPTLLFKETDKQLGLNKTNAFIIAALVGSENLEDWIGHRIQLYPTKTDFAGKRVDCIRVSDEFHEAPSGSNGHAKAAGKSKAAVEDDDEIPF